MSMFLAKWLVLLREKGLTFQTFTTHLKKKHYLRECHYLIKYAYKGEMIFLPMDSMTKHFSWLCQTF